MKRLLDCAQLQVATNLRGSQRHFGALEGVPLEEALRWDTNSLAFIARAESKPPERPHNRPL